MRRLKKWWERWVFLSMVMTCCIGAYLIIGGLIFRQWRDVLLGCTPWVIGIPYWSSRRDRA